MTILETERLLLREFTVEDAPFILDLLNQPSFIQFIGDRGVRTLEDAQRIIETRYMVSYRSQGFGVYLTSLREDQTPIGMCGLIKRDGLDDVDVGFAFLPHYWMKGYAFEAASAVVAYGRQRLGLGKIVGIATQDNAGSIRVLEKLGLKFERMIKLPNDDEELKLYS